MSRCTGVAPNDDQMRLLVIGDVVFADTRVHVRDGEAVNMQLHSLNFSSLLFCVHHLVDSCKCETEPCVVFVI